MLERVGKWTLEHDDLLRRMYEGGEPVKDITATINRDYGTSYTDDAVKSRACFRLGLRRKKVKETVWTAERKEQLEALIKRGLSYSEAAEALGTTRNAVGGQVQKLGLSRPVEEALLHRSLRRAMKERDAETKRDARRMAQLLNWTPGKYREEKPLPPVCEVVDDPLNLSLAEVGHKQCRWIMNEDLADAQYCGHPTTRKSWCARHAAVVATWCD